MYNSSYCVDLFEEFHKFIIKNKFKNDIKKVKQCKQNIYDPFHMEDDLWTHMVSCFQYYKNSNILSYTLDFDNNDLIIALFHDIGKIDVEPVNKERLIYHDHDSASTKYTIEFLWQLEENKKLDLLSFDTSYEILFTISNHSKFYNLANKLIDSTDINISELIDSITNFFNNDQRLVKRMLNLVKSDLNGSILSNDIINYQNKIIKIINMLELVISSVNFSEFDKNNVTPDIVFIGGYPRHDKAYLAGVESSVDYILSFDKLAREKYKENFDTSNMSDSEIDLESFYYCKNNEIKMNELLKSKISDYIHNGYRVGLDFLFFKSEYRNDMINIVRNIKNDIKIEYVLVIPPILECEKVNKMMNSPLYDRKTLDNVGKHIDIPIMLYENFNKVSTYANRSYII